VASEQILRANISPRFVLRENVVAFLHDRVSEPHLASFACGGSSVVVPGLNVSTRRHTELAHPHPPLSANLLLSFTMQKSVVLGTGTVVSGKYSFFSRDPMDLRHLALSGKGFPLPGMPAW
jgi:hypothetical protein